MKSFKETFDLSENEFIFLKKFVKNNTVLAENFNELGEDNFSYQSIVDFCETYEDDTPQSFGGFVSSLKKKGVILIDEREDDVDLFYISDAFIEVCIENGFGDISFNNLDLNEENSEDFDLNAHICFNPYDTHIDDKIISEDDRYSPVSYKLPEGFDTGVLISVVDKNRVRVLYCSNRKINTTNVSDLCWG